MKLYGEFTKIEPLDDGTIRVSGIASTGAVDDAGETVTPAAMKAALPDYMKFGAVREMHGLSAAGTALKTSVDDEGATQIEALVVDPIAVKKVQAGVYKGFSIGGKVLGRDPMNKTIITALRLNEISLVDRPCNPEAVIGMWKADGAHLEDDMTDATQTEAASGPTNEQVRAEAERLAKAAGRDGKWSNYVTKARAALIKAPEIAPADPAPEADTVEKTTPEIAPEQEQRPGAETDPAAAVAAALEKAKGAAKKPYGDVAYADPENSKYPIDTPAHIRAAWSYVNMPKNAAKLTDPDAVKAKIIAAWKAKIDPKGPPSAEKMAAVLDLAKTAAALRHHIARAPDEIAKGMYQVSRLAELIDSLSYLQMSITYEAEAEQDQSPLPQEAAESVAALLTLLANLVSEESAEILHAYETAGLDMDLNVDGDDEDVIAYAAALTDLAKADTDLMEKVGARHSKVDMQNIQAGHDAMTKLGAMCDPGNCPAEDADKAALIAERDGLAKALIEAAPAIEDLGKTIAAQGEELAALRKTAGEVDDLKKRLADIETRAAPPKMIVGSAAVSKTQDANPDGSGANGARVVLSDDALAKYLDSLPEAERGMILLKGSLANPIRVPTAL